MFSPTRVSVAALFNTSYKLIFPLAVADTSVMLALMAGRNAGEGVTLVKEGKVCRVTSAWHPILPVDGDLGISGPTSPSARSSSLGLS
jgi:lactate dehydrogenase-like 2-hydroxyacid dehydrogenase